VLVQSALLPIPKDDAHVAFAVGADPKPTLANNQLATAPATSMPGILRDGLTMLGASILLLQPRRERLDAISQVRCLEGRGGICTSLESRV
jgi:hypothetical protein